MVLNLKITYFTRQGGYSVVTQSLVNSQKRFMDVYVGLFQSVNDSCVLRKSKLYQHAIHGGFFDMATRPQDGIPLYLLGNKGYPLVL